MKKEKQIIEILILSVSIFILAVLGTKTWMNQKVIRILNEYNKIDFIQITLEQEKALAIQDSEQIKQIKNICQLQSLYATKEVKKRDSAALVELQFYAQKALVGTARLYKLADGSFMEQEKQARFCTADGFYYVLEWENRWAFPLKESDAQTLLALQAAGS